MKPEQELTTQAGKQPVCPQMVQVGENTNINHYSLQKIANTLRVFIAEVKKNVQYLLNIIVFVATT